MTLPEMPEDWLMLPHGGPSDVPPLTEYLHWADQGDFRMPFCARCGQVLDIDQIRCEGCQDGTPVWRSVELAGEVLAAIVMHRLEPGLVRATDPYVVAEILLRSGHRIVASTAEPSQRLFSRGEAVRLELRRVGQHRLPRISTNPPRG